MIRLSAHELSSPQGRSACLIALCALALTSANAAQARGTAAGTEISNTATAIYRNGSTEQKIRSNTVETRLNEVIECAVKWRDPEPVLYGPGEVLTFQVTNSGNAPRPLTLQASLAQAEVDAGFTISGLALDSNETGTYDAQGDAALANGGATAAIPADQSVTVFVFVEGTAEGAPQGAQIPVDLKVICDPAEGEPGTVYPNGGFDNTDAIVGLNGSSDVDTGLFTISRSEVALIKSATVSDPYGGNRPVPGATITYSIKAMITNPERVDGLVVSDAIPALTTYVPNSLRLDGVALTDARDADAGNASATGISVAIDAANTGASHTTTFQVLIN